MKALLFSLALCFGLPAWAFSSKDVSVHNVSDNVVLAGTLTLPDDGEPRAAIIMATGSGAQDRDETVAGHKPFKAIAEHMSGRGYAVLRMDDRGVGGSTGARENVTTSSNVRDVEAGLAWLDSAYSHVPAGCGESKVPVYRHLGRPGVEGRFIDNGAEPRACHGGDGKMGWRGPAAGFACHS